MWVTQFEKPNVIPGLTRNLCRFFEILAFARMIYIFPECRMGAGIVRDRAAGLDVRGAGRECDYMRGIVWKQPPFHNNQISYNDSNSLSGDLGLGSAIRKLIMKVGWTSDFPDTYPGHVS